MTKVRKRKCFLWLNRPKRQYTKWTTHFTPVNSKHVQRRQTPSTVKYCCSPKALNSPYRSAGKRILTPCSSQKKSRKRLNMGSSMKSKKRLSLSYDDTELEFEPIEDDEENTQQNIQDFVDMGTDHKVLQILSSTGLLYYLTQFFFLLKVNRYPHSNIALWLWIETVKWYGCMSASSMWYFESTLRFWRAGYRLFHGKFLSFMSGPKCLGQILKSESVNPGDSEINFIVPNRNTLVNSDKNHPTVIKPGIIEQTLSALKAHKSTDIFMMCADGKKVTAGLDKDYGDVNMFGYDTKPTIHDTRERLDKELNIIDNALEVALVAETTNHDYDRKRISQVIQTILRLLTLRVKDVRETKAKQEYGLKKLTEKAGNEWRSSKYHYAICGIQAFLYRIQKFIESSLQNLSNLCHLGSELNGGSRYFVNSQSLKASTQENMRILKPPNDQTQPVPTWLTKQRTDEWHSIRSIAKVTGSTLHNAIGLRSLKHQKEHYDKVYHNKEIQVSDAVKQRMEHGTINEPNALATLVGVFMPFYFPNHTYSEEGCYLLDGNTNNIIEVSPDGILVNVKSLSDTNSVSVEIKCPYPKEKDGKSTNIMYDVPSYYVCQFLSEMSAQKTNNLIFVCYTKESTTFLEVQFDEELWNMIKDTSDELYGMDLPKRPTKLSPNTKELKDRISKLYRQMCVFW